MAKTVLNTSLVKQVVVAAEANKRVAISSTKTRGNVSGGGKKPWKQKGTGRARAGSSRSPLWRGGGKTFGPSSERNFAHKTPQKMVKAALAQVFNYLNDHKQIIIADKLVVTEPKTKLALALLTEIGVNGKKATLITSEHNAMLVVACRNIPNITVVENHNVSVLDIVHAKVVVMDNISAETRGLISKINKLTKAKGFQTSKIKNSEKPKSSKTVKKTVAKS